MSVLSRILDNDRTLEVRSCLKLSLSPSWNSFWRFSKHPCCARLSSQGFTQHSLGRLRSRLRRQLLKYSTVASDANNCLLRMSSILRDGNRLFFGELQSTSVTFFAAGRRDGQLRRKSSQRVCAPVAATCNWLRRRVAVSCYVYAGLKICKPISLIPFCNINEGRPVC